MLINVLLDSANETVTTAIVTALLEQWPTATVNVLDWDSYGVTIDGDCYHPLIALVDSVVDSAIVSD